MRMMSAKYPGKCSACGGSIARKEEILWSRDTGAIHPRCYDRESGAPKSTLDRRESGIVYTRTASGYESYQNRKGRCEDAPCCGCCS